MTGAPQLTVVVPVHDEAGNIGPLVREVVGALRGVVAFELVYVDDASCDATLSELLALKVEVPELRVLRHAVRAGQSTAIRNGVKAARSAWIATLDGDGQNDPADLPKLLAAREAAAPEVKLLTGWRVSRKDTAAKRWASRAANAIRRRLLHDDTPDTGCGTKLFEREAFLDLPYFDHMHRYLPALMQRAGWRTLSLPVHHRARGSGVSKYRNLSRAIVGLRDLRGVAWLVRRSHVTRAEEL
ncbi:MAG TPA: glycosyltransferase family 2 protein [Xanthomonadaceae bacterium]|nr:glycosyltransferase family 2 protein [Xanthomonadaceae bacterium]